MTQFATPIYGITYADDLEPLANYPDVTLKVATTVEAALKRGGIAPPNASDLAALAGRVSTLETDAGPTEIAYGTGFARYADTRWNGAQYKRRGALVSFGGAMKATAAIAAETVVATLPVGCRPAFTQWLSSTFSMVVEPNGKIIVVQAVALNAVWGFSGTWVATS